MRTFIALTTLTLAACGELIPTYTDAAPPPVSAPDAGADDAGIEPPPPAHFVVSAITLPATGGDAQGIAFDLDGDGSLDNQIGQMFVALRNATATDEGFGTDAAISRAIVNGSLIGLVSYQGPASVDDAAATFTMSRGTAPRPEACAPDGTCGHHLRGDGSFAVAGTARAPLSGTTQRSAGRESFIGGPGALTLPFAFAASLPFELPLIGAHAELTGINAAGIDRLVVGGAITSDVMWEVFVPKLAAALQLDVAADCADLIAPSCGCADGSRGKNWIQLFDSAADCRIEEDELAFNSLIQTVTAPDVMIDGVAGTSISIAMTATNATLRP